MMPLAIPLSQRQIDAAGRLRAHLKQWELTDKALSALAEAFPDFGQESSLLKVAAVNQLYGTNLYAVVRMAEHVVHVMSERPTSFEGAELVERLASLPKPIEQKTYWHHYSFASKFAHFFIDNERFPIYDDYARKMVEFHLGSKEKKKDDTHPYIAFVGNLTRLRELSDVTASVRELDHYLWLAGQYQNYRKNGEKKDYPMQTNTELLSLFKSHQVDDDLKILNCAT